MTPDKPIFQIQLIHSSHYKMCVSSSNLSKDRYHRQAYYKSFTDFLPSIFPPLTKDEENLVGIGDDEEENLPETENLLHIVDSKETKKIINVAFSLQEQIESIYVLM